MTTIDPRIVEEFNKRCPFPLTPDNLLVLVRVGSHSHGTYMPPEDQDSIDDVDFMGIVIPPPSYTIGVKQWDGCVIKRDELDVVFYPFSKFIRLLIKANPNVLGTLWIRDEDIVARHKLWDKLRDGRKLFAARNAYQSFIGYASAQLHKMTAFDGAVTDEWDNAVAFVIAAGWKVDDVTDKSAALPMPNYAALRQYLTGLEMAQDYSDKYLDGWLAEAKISIQKIHARHFQGYMGLKRKRLVKKYGIDVKNASHLIRLLRMGIGFLRTGDMEVYRIDAQELIDIKQGRWPLDRVKKHAEELFAEAKIACETSMLPEFPDIEEIDRLTVAIHEIAYNGAYSGECDE